MRSKSQAIIISLNLLDRSFWQMIRYNFSEAAHENVIFQIMNVVGDNWKTQDRQYI